MNKRAVLYARVSSDDQADKGYSLPTQLEYCRKYAERLGYLVLAELREDCSGAVPMAERLEGKKLVAMLKARQADVLIGYQVDRLSRDIVDLLASVRVWLRAGVEVHACDIGKIESELDIVLVIKGWQGSDERKKIAERTTRGRNGKAQAGKVVEQGKPPYAYRFGNGVLEIVEAEGKIVALIYRWYTLGKGDTKPLTIRAITLELSNMAILAPGEKWNAKRTRPSGVWNESTVRKILTNETYAGVWRYGKRIGAGGNGGGRAKDDHILVTVPAIVDRATWEAAQEQRAYNLQMAARNCRREYLLRGLIRCGNCGKAWSGRYGTRGIYYECTNRHHHFDNLEAVCKEGTVSGSILEARVWEYVLDIITDPKRFEDGIRKAQDNERDALGPKRERREAVMAMIADCEVEAAKLAGALKQTPDGGIVHKHLQADIETTERRYAALCKERDELQAALNANPLTDENIAAAIEFRRQVVEGLRDPTFEDKRRVLEFLRVKVTIKDKHAQVQCIIPIQKDAIDLTTNNSRVDARGIFAALSNPRPYKTPSALPQ